MAISSGTRKVESETLPFVTEVAINGLFGYREVQLKFAVPAGSDDDEINILYGDNGSGKTTALRFIYEFLHPAPGGGHKTWIARLPFRSATIALNGGTTYSIVKSKGLTGDFVVTQTGTNASPLRYRILTDEEDAVSADIKGNQDKELLASLSRLEIEMFYITDDRRYLSTSSSLIKDTAERPEIQGDTWTFTTTTYHRIADRLGQHMAAPKSVLNVTQLAENLADLFRQEIAAGGMSVQRSTNSIYQELVDKLARSRRRATPNRDKLLGRLEYLHNRMEPFLELGAISDFDVRFFSGKISSAKDETLGRIDLVITPFLDSIASSLDILESAVDRMLAFVTELNRFYTDKEFRFSYDTGLSVYSRSARGPVSFDWLSSGERQLFIILSSVFLAQRGAGIILIDEPELSLNVMWQREFVSALHRLAQSAPVQYILASHSPEILNSRYARELAVGS